MSGVIDHFSAVCWVAPPAGCGEQTYECSCFLFLNQVLSLKTIIPIVLVFGVAVSYIEDDDAYCSMSSTLLLHSSVVIPI